MKPSDRIEEIFKIIDPELNEDYLVDVPKEPAHIYIRAIIQYLDEQYDNQ